MEINNIYQLKKLFQIPENVFCFNGTKVDAIEALCIFLRPFAYPNGDMVPAFGSTVPELCMITCDILNHVHINNGRVLRGFGHQRMSHAALGEYARVVRDKGAALDFCWGFIDGTVRPVSRPRQNQRSCTMGTNASTP